jgi:hypothetical protein
MALALTGVYAAKAKRCGNKAQVWASLGECESDAVARRSWLLQRRIESAAVARDGGLNIDEYSFGEILLVK